MVDVKYIKKANDLLEKSYSPYSKFRVAAIVIDQDMNEYGGVNVENSSYGLCLCAERNAITTGVTNTLKTIKYIYITADTDRPVSPCGACRQVISEFSNEDTKIILGNSKNEKYQVFTRAEILPYFFEPTDLDV